MKYSENYIIGMEDTGRNNFATNKSLITIMEEIAGLHSASVGFGVLDIDRIGMGWVLLDWKMKVIKRPKYSDVVKAVTWSRGTDRLRAFRDFRLEDQKGNVYAVGTSTWVLIDINKRRPLKIEYNVISAYKCEDENVFPEKLKNIKLPDVFKNCSAGGLCRENEDALSEAEEKIKLKCAKFKVTRRDIDINNHMHNISYIDAANEILPDNVYDNEEYNCLRVTYKKEARYGQEIECVYAQENDCHYVCMQSESGIHAIMELGKDIY